VNRYTTREIVKAAAGITGSRFDASVDQGIESASRQIDAATHTWFIPKIETRKFDAVWPVIVGNTITFDSWLQSVTTFTDEGDNAASITSTDYRLLPENDGPPYYAAEILTDVAGAEFKADPSTPQQSFRITGPWGAYSSTAAATSLSAALSDTSGTVVDIKDSSTVDVGDTILVGSEQMFVSERVSVALAAAAQLSDALLADLTDKSLGVDDPTDDLQVGEIILINAEQMRITSSASATALTIERAVNGTTLAAHSINDPIYVERRLTVVRGVNGTTAATALDDAVVTKYQPPSDIRALATALAVDEFKQGQAGWGREVGRGESAREFSGTAIAKLRKRVVRAHRRNVTVSI